MSETIHPNFLIEPTPDPSLLQSPTPTRALPLTFIAALFLVMAVLWVYRKSSKRPPAIPTFQSRELTAYRNALSQLHHLSDHPTPDNAIQASTIIRHYLYQTIEDPAITETHEELSQRPHAFAKLPPEIRSTTLAGLNHLATGKYTNHRSLQSPKSLAQDAIELLETIHRSFSS